MDEKIKAWALKHKQCWTDHGFVHSVAEGVLLLVGTFFILTIAGAYTVSVAGNGVNDLILDYLKPRDVNFIFIDLAVVFTCFIIALFVYEPKWLPFVMRALALFYLIRSAFMVLTHLGPIPEQTLINTDNFLLEHLTFKHDYFFSGHTGLPFLFTLMFWHRKWLRFFFLASSLAGGAAVLFGHLHYSIDVFAAFFITYGIFHIAQKFFSHEYELFLQG